MIVLKNIDFSLSAGSIQDAIDEILKFKEDLAEGLSELARILTMEGAEIAKMHVIQMDAIWTGLLSEAGIVGEYDARAHEGTISTDLEYAVLVEYGTGFVGEHSQHPGIGDPEWHTPGSVSVFGKTYDQYDTNKHRQRGWLYEAPWGWIIDSKGRQYAWTMGRPAKPFMYRTFKDLEEEAERRGATFIAQYIP